MPIGILFWFLMICWLIFGFFAVNGPWAWGGHILIWVLFALLGWKSFGSILQG